jgi:peptide methionine sulfoxide reductase MsrA
VAYEELLTVFWDLIDPTTLNRQGGDAGTQYRSGIYYHDDHQRLAAQRLGILMPLYSRRGIHVSWSVCPCCMLELGA